MTESETVELLTALLLTQEPFVHLRFGDGDVFFATGTGPRLTADGEEWSDDLMFRLRTAWQVLAAAKVRLLVGDVESYAVSDGCEEQWAILKDEAEAIGGPLELVHIEALRVGFGHALPFYIAVKNDQRRKAFVAPVTLTDQVAALGCQHIPIPLHVSHLRADEIAAEVAQTGCDVALFAAGRGGKIMQAALAQTDPTLTQIDVGSGLDLLSPHGVRRGTDLRIDRDRILGIYRRAGLA